MSNDFAQRSRDKIVLMQLAEVAEPTSYDKVMLGALLMRYQADPGRLEDIELVVRSWKMTPKQLYKECRTIWADGFRPEDTDLAGSGWDSNTTENN